VSKGFGREYPKGRMSADDDGQAQIAIASDLKAQRVVVRFERPMLWIGLDAEAGINMLIHLAKHLSVVSGQEISVKIGSEQV
jgi:hypothetical protein